MVEKHEFGAYSRLWQRDHRVMGLMQRRVAALVEAKEHGSCVLPAELDEGMTAFLSVSRQRLGRLCGNFPKLGPRSPARALFHKATGLGGMEDELGPRAFVAEQALSLDPRCWAEPVRCIINGAGQVAAHHTVLEGGGKSETALNEALVARLLGFLSEEVVPAFADSGTRLPTGKTIDFASTSMQSTKGDILDSDLAIVVGTEICGVPRYRVAIFQAKRMQASRRVDVSYKDGAQLDGILSTGMGFYLFYPPDGTPTAVPPTVKTAVRVFAEARREHRDSIGTVAAFDRTGWDFGTFLGYAMTSSVPGVGRIFPSAEAAAAALLGLRKRPSRILLLSTSVDARIWKLVTQLGAANYSVSDPASLADAVSAALEAPREPTDPEPGSLPTPT